MWRLVDARTRGDRGILPKRSMNRSLKTEYQEGKSSTKEELQRLREDTARIQKIEIKGDLNKWRYSVQKFKELILLRC